VPTDEAAERRPLLLSWSGGKDSALTLDVLRRAGGDVVGGLLTTITEGVDRISMHGVRRCLLDAQAAAIGLPVTVVPIPERASNEAYEEAMARALADLRRRGTERVAFGDLHLADVRAYREEQLAAVEMEAAFPVWGWDTEAFAADVLDRGFRAVVVCVDGAALDPAFCGRAYDEAFLAELPDDVDPCGENGEFHTFVHDGPGFAAPVRVTRGEQELTSDQLERAQFLPGPGLECRPVQTFRAIRLIQLTEGERRLDPVVVYLPGPCTEPRTHLQRVPEHPPQGDAGRP
jgi:uncharacterized protein (TIGR00290 family)